MRDWLHELRGRDRPAWLEPGRQLPGGGQTLAERVQHVGGGLQLQELHGGLAGGDGGQRQGQ